MHSLSIKPILRNFIFTAALAGTVGFAVGAHAQQSFSASIDGTAWESDHKGITVIPVAMGGTLTIEAISKGFSAYPPPKGFPDRISVVCPLPTKPQRFVVTRDRGIGCRMSFTKAARNVMSPDWATVKNEGEFASRGGSGDKSYVNFTTVLGKTVEGEFSMELVEESTKKKIAVSGKFRGIDSQVGSTGFN